MLIAALLGWSLYLCLHEEDGKFRSTPNVPIPAVSLGQEGRRKELDQREAR